MEFPPPCPEIPVADLNAALACYRDQLGFAVDWAEESIGLAGVSRGGSRMFLSTPAFRAALGTSGPVLIWLNLANRAEVDALHAEWAAAGVSIEGPPGTRPYHKLYEFFARDVDGNTFRVFYDYGWETR